VAGARASFGLRDVDRGWKALMREARGAANRQHSYAKAGIIGEKAQEAHAVEPGAAPMTNVTLAATHEFGVPGKLPERSFVRSSFDKHREEYWTLLRSLVGTWFIAASRMPLHQALGIIGLKMAADMKAGILEGAGIPPPNAPATIARKLAKGKWNRRSPEKVAEMMAAGKGPRTLIDTGQLVRSITHEVVLSGRYWTSWKPTQALPGVNEAGGPTSAPIGGAE
jgi:hypothetical protein